MFLLVYKIIPFFFFVALFDTLNTAREVHEKKKRKKKPFFSVYVLEYDIHFWKKSTSTV